MGKGLKLAATIFLIATITRVIGATFGLQYTTEISGIVMKIAAILGAVITGIKIHKEMSE